MKQTSSSKPVLSACVPTYNRRAALKETLDRLVEAAQQCNGNLEICVSDNASQDGTYAMLQKYAKLRPFVRVQQNKENIGADRNYAVVLKMARGKYCWIVGDDDTPLPSSIKAMVASLRDGPDYAAGFIAAGSKAQIEDVRRFFPESAYSAKEFTEICGLALRGRTREGLVLNGFVPSYLFNRKLLERGGYAAMDGHLNGFWHLSFFSYCLRDPGAKVLIHREPAVLYGQHGTPMDYIFLPPQELELFVYNRLDAVDFPQVRSALAGPARHYLARFGARRYMFGIVRIMCLKSIFDEGQYNEMKTHLYSLGDAIEMPTHYRAAVIFLKAAERVWPLRKAIAFAYVRIAKYGRQVAEYRKGRLKTSREREGI